MRARDLKGFGPVGSNGPKYSAAPPPPAEQASGVLPVHAQKALPGGAVDDTSFQQIEDALDRGEAPMRAVDGRWLTLAERIAAMPTPQPRHTCETDPDPLKLAYCHACAEGRPRPDTGEHVRKLVGKLDQWRACMSYNDSYFGEPAGLVKSTVAELSRAVDPARPSKPKEPAPAADVGNAVELACIQFHGDLGWKGMADHNKGALRERMARALKAASIATPQVSGGGEAVEDLRSLRSTHAAYAAQAHTKDLADLHRNKVAALDAAIAALSTPQARPDGGDKPILWRVKGGAWTDIKHCLHPCNGPIEYAYTHPAPAPDVALAIPVEWREFVEHCAKTAGGMVPGNNLAIAARKLLAAPQEAESEQ